MEELNDSLAPGEAGPQQFWAKGPEALDAVLGSIGVVIRPDDDIVELGCGIGGMTRPIAERGRSVRALDVSAELLAEARRKNAELGNVAWLHGDGESLTGVGTGSADGVISYAVFEHIQEPEVILGYVREMGRVLRPGGWAAFQVSNDPGGRRPRERPSLRSRLRALVGKAPESRPEGATTGSSVAVAQVRQAASASGMEIERTQGAGTRSCLVLARKRD